MGIERPINGDVAGKRKAKRARVLLSARLVTPFGEIDCRLRDLSPKGALVECNPAPPTGTEVVFVRGPMEIPARVAWSQPGRIGLEFAFPIVEASLMVQLNPSKAKETPRYRRPALKEGLSEHERKLAAAWRVQVGINLPDEDL